VLLWITVNLARGESVNFNPILADVAPEERDDLVFKVKKEASTINLEHLEPRPSGAFQGTTETGSFQLSSWERDFS
jgi:hypothetical protein